MKKILVFTLVLNLFLPLSQADNIIPFSSSQRRSCSNVLSLKTRPNPLKSARLLSFSDHFIPQKPNYISHRGFLKNLSPDFSKLYIYQPHPSGSPKPSFGKFDSGKWVHFGSAEVSTNTPEVYIIEAHAAGPRELNIEHSSQHHAKFYTHVELQPDLIMFYEFLSLAAQTQHPSSTTLPNLKFTIIETELASQILSVLENWHVRDPDLFEFKQELLSLTRNAQSKLWNLKERNAFFQQFFGHIYSHLKKQGVDSEKLDFIYTRFFHLD